MKITCRPPEILPAQQNAIKQFLTVAFNHKNLVARPSYELLVPTLYLWVDGKPKYLHDGYWQMNDRYIGVGQENGYMSYKGKLIICLALLQLIEPDEALAQAAEKAIADYLLRERREVKPESIIVAEKEVTGIAVCDDKIASLVGGQWWLANGETVNVTELGWVVATTQLPATAVVGVDEATTAIPDVEF